MGRTEFLTWKTITSEPTVGKATPSPRAKWRSSLSAGSSVLEKCLTRADIVREAILQQSPRSSPAQSRQTQTCEGCARIAAFPGKASIQAYNDLWPVFQNQSAAGTNGLSFSIIAAGCAD